MGRAFLALYACTGDRAWLRKAEQAIEFISVYFATGAGYVTCAHIGAVKSQPQLDENIGIARLANLLWHYTGQRGIPEVAERAMRFVADAGSDGSPWISCSRCPARECEISSSPLHITVVGRKDDPEGAETLRGCYSGIENLQANRVARRARRALYQTRMSSTQR